MKKLLLLALMPSLSFALNADLVNLTKEKTQTEKCASGWELAAEEKKGSINRFSASFKMDISATVNSKTPYTANFKLIPSTNAVSSIHKTPMVMSYKDGSILHTEELKSGTQLTMGKPSISDNSYNVCLYVSHSFLTGEFQSVAGNVHLPIMKSYIYSNEISLIRDVPQTIEIGEDVSITILPKIK